MQAGTAIAAPGLDSVFVTLSLAGQLCGLPVRSVRDVLRHLTITPVALASPDIAGILNLRGHVVTAIDLRRRLQLPKAPEDGPRYAVVAEDDGEMFALLADGIHDVITLDPRELMDIPPTLPANWGRYSRGLHRLDTGLMIVLDLPRLLALSGEVA